MTISKLIEILEAHGGDGSCTVEVRFDETDQGRSDIHAVTVELTCSGEVAGINLIAYEA